MPTVPNYDALKTKQTELIRKALDGSAFKADIAVDVITTLTADSTTTPGTPELNALPTGYEDLGFLTSDGIAFARDVSSSDITSFGSVQPTRTDVTSDSSTVTVVCQETKLATISLATGAAASGITPDATTGEVSIAKPQRPSAKAYRLLTLAVDEGDAGEIWIARFFPRAKVTAYAEQSYASGDAAIGWGVTFTGEVDSTVGYSERWLFGGPGWQALLPAMGFTG